MQTFIKVIGWILLIMLAIFLAPVVLPIIFAIFLMILGLLATIAMAIFGGFMWMVASLFAFLGG